MVNVCSIISVHVSSFQNNSSSRETFTKMHRYDRIRFAIGHCHCLFFDRFHE